MDIASVLVIAEFDLVAGRVSELPFQSLGRRVHTNYCSQEGGLNVVPREQALQTRTIPRGYKATVRS